MECHRNAKSKPPSGICHRIPPLALPHLEATNGSVIDAQAQDPIDIGPFRIDSLVKANDKEVVIGIASQSIIDGQLHPEKAIVCIGLRLSTTS